MACFKRHAVLILLAFALVPWQASAHGMHAGHTDLLLTDEGALFVTLELSSGDAASFFGEFHPSAGKQEAPEAVASYFLSRFAVAADGKPCMQQLPWQWQSQGQQAETVWLFEAQFACPTYPAELAVLNRLLFERPNGYRHSLVLRAPTLTATGRTDLERESASFPLPPMDKKDSAFWHSPAFAWAAWGVAIAACAACVAMGFFLWRKRSLISR